MNSRSKAILRTITPGRVINLILLRCSYYLSYWFKRDWHWGMPMAVSIEPTTACNLRCPQCPSGLRQFTRDTGNLKPALNEQILNQLGSKLQHINYYFQGEPFINPHFLELVTQARARNIYVVTSTNAHFISPETAVEIIKSGLNELIISIDGTTQESYESYRIEGELNRVVDGTKHLLEARKKMNAQYPVVTFQFLVTAANEHQLEEINALQKNLGVDRLTLKTLQIYDFESGHELIPSDTRYSRYRKKQNGEWELKNRYRNACWRSWSSCVITWDGLVVPCCFDKDAKHRLGKISQSSFREIWKGQVNQLFRKKILQNRKQIEICRNCSEGSQVWV